MAGRVFQPTAPSQKPPWQWQVDRNHPLARRLVGCWLFNEGGGGRALDMTATPAPGTLTNAPRWEVVGGSGGGLALRFTAASSQYVLVGNPTKLQITGALTIATHYQIPAGVPSSSQMLVTKDDNVSQRSWSMDVASGASGGVRLYINGGNGDLVTNTGCENRAPVAGEGRAVVGVYDPSGPQVRVYANGALAGSSTSADASIPSSTATVQFGGRVSAESYLNGWLRYVYIWNRVLSASEIQQLAAAPYAMFIAPLVVPFVPGLQFAHPISDISAGTWTPSSGTDLYAMVDEAVADDTDWIQSSVNPAADTAEVALTPLTDPVSSTSHVVRYRIRMRS